MTAKEDAVLQVSDHAVVTREGVIGNEIPTRLSRNETKRALYGFDIDFLDGWHTLDSVASHDVAEAWVSRVALALVKPDATIRGLTQPLLAFLRESGFAVIAAEIVTVDEDMCRNLWRYQWNMATRARRVVTAHYMSMAPCLLLALRCSSTSQLGTDRLAHVKGSADPAGRGVASLRSRFAASNKVVNLLHSADEPADVVRELQIFLGTSRGESFVDTAVGCLRSDREAPGLDRTVSDLGRFVVDDQMRATWAQLLSATEALVPDVPALRRVMS